MTPSTVVNIARILSLKYQYWGKPASSVKGDGARFDGTKRLMRITAKTDGCAKQNYGKPYSHLILSRNPAQFLPRYSCIRCRTLPYFVGKNGADGDMDPRPIALHFPLPALDLQEASNPHTAA